MSIESLLSKLGLRRTPPRIAAGRVPIVRPVCREVILVPYGRPQAEPSKHMGLYTDRSILN